MGGDGVLTNCTAGEGDSGGPTYVYRSDGAYIVNIFAYWYDKSGTGCNGAEYGPNSAGTSGDHIAEAGITFDT